MKRLVEADVLRTAAIALIVLTHLPDYLPLPGLQPYTVYTIILGNGLFIFLSGYLTHAATRGRPRSTLASLMGHRLLRLMPLYWLALATFAVLVLEPDVPTMLIHAAGLQIVLAPAAVTPMVTLWFVGMVLAFYLMYYAVVRHASRPRDMLLLASLALLPLIAVRAATGLLEVRFFLYYFVFMAGAVACESGLLERTRSRVIGAAIVSAVVSLGLFVLVGSPLVEESGGLGDPAALILSMVLSDGVIISSALLLWTAARKVAPRLSSRSIGLFAACSAASYFVYLFHRPALVAATSAMSRMSMGAPLQLVTVALLVLPALFMAGARVQGCFDRLARRFAEGFKEGSCPSGPRSSRSE